MNLNIHNAPKLACTSEEDRKVTACDSVVVKTFFRSRDRDRDLDKMNSSALESRDHGLEITTLARGRSLKTG